MEEYQYIVVAGNINEGFSFIGPFMSFDEASDYADTMNVPTWISEITTPPL